MPREAGRTPSAGLSACLATLVASVAAAGCTLGGPAENREEIDRGDYTGGEGLAVALRNDASGAFDVRVHVRGPDGGEVASLDRTLAAGEAYERWWTLPRGSYDLRMTYAWNAQTGRSAGGDDARSVDLHECPLVSRAQWAFRELDDTIGSAYLGKTCAGP